jgi:hypothetical protein
VFPDESSSLSIQDGRDRRGRHGRDAARSFRVSTGVPRSGKPEWRQPALAAATPEANFSSICTSGGWSAAYGRLVRGGCRASRRSNNVLPRNDEGGDNPGDDIAQPDQVRARIRGIGGHGSLPWIYLLEQFIWFFTLPLRRPGVARATPTRSATPPAANPFAAWRVLRLNLRSCSPSSMPLLQPASGSPRPITFGWN